jgi:two-component system, chemotaxis family, sensor kinase CheA
MVSRKVARLFRKHFEIENPEAALNLVRTLAANPGIQAPDARRIFESFPEFVASIEEAYRELDERLSVAVRALELSSNELSESNQKLEDLNFAIEAILESLGQALLYFGPDGICAPVYSKACLTLLEAEPKGKHIADILRMDGAQQEQFLPLLHLIFSEDATAMPFEELILLAPQWYRHSKDLKIALAYKPMRGPSGAINGVLLVATDITQKLETREKLAQKEEQVLRTLRIAGNRGGYVRYLHSFETAFRTMKNANSLNEIRRDLHTLKGMARVFYLSTVAALLHEIEDSIADIPEDDWQYSFEAVMAGYQVRVELMLEYARWLGREIWGYEFENGKDIMSVATQGLYQFGLDLEAMLAEKAPPERIVESYFMRIASVPVMERLSFFEMQVGYFAEVADRQVRMRHEAGDDVRIFPEFYGDFFDSLTHIARNILDHAYEPPAMREILGKLPELHVTLKTVYADETRKNFIITIADDGQGISAAEVRDKLEQDGKPVRGEADEDIIQHIFDADFSTKDSIDINSGRGVGMNVVKAEVEKLGGTVRVASRHGFSTIFTITLPVIWRRPG